MMHHGMPLKHLLSNHMQSTSMGEGAAKALFCRNIMEACEAREHGGDSKRKHQVERAIIQAKEWTQMFGRCKPVEHAVTKQQCKHECTGKSLVQLFVRVLKFFQNHLRLSHPPRLFHPTKSILIPLKVHTPNNICVPCYRLKTHDIYL
jgi:hypothetical protein